MGLEYSKNTIDNALRKTQDAYLSFLFNPRTRAYFDIEQEVLFRKIGFSLFPFSIQNNSDSEVESKTKMFSPQLYLPLMSLITFVLLSCLRTVFSLGTIQPVGLINEISGCVSFTLFEGLLCVILLYFGSGIMISYVDCVSFAGYKYVLLDH